MKATNSKYQMLTIFLTVFLYLVGFGVVIPILPILSTNFGATALQTGLLLSVYSLMQFIFLRSGVVFQTNTVDALF